MDVQYGQIWRKNDNHEVLVFICGINEFVWYTTLKRFGNSDDKWQKAKQENFVAKYGYTNCRIKAGDYWKTKSNGTPFQIFAVKDNGHNRVIVYFNFERVDIGTFYEYYEPCSVVEDALLKIHELIPKEGEPTEENRLNSIMEIDETEKKE